MNLTEHFTLEELTRSATAQQRHITNTPDPQQTKALKALAQNILEPLRTHFRQPITISSAFRSKTLNQLVGGKPNSQHLLGEAADIRIPIKDNKQDLTLAHRYIDYIRARLDYDQLILEHNANKNYWIHVSYTTRRPNRRQYIPNLQK